MVSLRWGPVGGSEAGRSSVQGTGEGALPPAPSGWRPGLLGQLLLQLFETLLGGSFGPEPPQAGWEALVQHTLQRTGTVAEGPAAAQSHPESPSNPDRGFGAGPTSSMKAPTKLKATRPSSSSLKQMSAMFLSVRGPCRRPGARRRPTRMEPKSSRATRKGTGGGGVCQAREPLHTHMQAKWEPPNAPAPTAPHPTPPRGSTVGV